MASKAATYLAFGTIVKRSLTTSIPLRVFQRPQHVNFHQSLQTTSKATKGRKLPRNHFTSNSQAIDTEAKDNENVQKDRQRKEPRNKRKAAQRQTENPSLRRVAVEAQRSRSTLIKRRGKSQYVDPDAHTKDITAYCAAEQYNLHVARDCLKKEGYNADPCHTGLFPHVLHVQTPPSWFRGSGGEDTATDELNEQKGDIFVFPTGCVVVWNVTDKLGLHLAQEILKPATESGRAELQEVEDLDYIEDFTREHSEVIGDTIILGTKPSTDQPEHEHLPSETTISPPPPEERSPDLDTTLAKIAFSSAIARSTKLAVFENTLNNYMSATRNIPRDLAKGLKPRLPRRLVLRRTGQLLSLRADLNLYSELTDSLPDVFWDSPHSLGLESYYDAMSASLDVDIRIKLLNEKMDYASEITAVLRDHLGEQRSHQLEWIIIWLIVFEVAFGIWHIYVEVSGWRDPESEENLAREWYHLQLEKERAEREDRR